MSWETKDYYEYGSSSHAKSNYANPEFYQQKAAPVAASQASAAHLTSSYDPAQLEAYQGPASLESYTTDAGAEQREAAESSSSSESTSKKRGFAAIGGWLLPFAAILLKFGIPSFTALLSVFVYAQVFGWTLAVGFVAILFIHEMGHALVMRLKKIPMGAMIFIPMLGAAVTMKQMPQNARDEAEVGIAGPVAGAIAATVCLILANIYPHQVWTPLAYLGFLLNLINLAPVMPLDGGRVLAAIDRRVWIIGFLGLLAFVIWTWINGNFSPWLLFIVFMAGAQLWARRQHPDSPEGREYYNVPPLARASLGLLYFGLAIVLALGMTMAHGMMFPYGG